MSHYVVVGAGVAGLTIAHQLSPAGHAVTVVERDAVVGGLARSWHYGDFHFDVGPHRFHTDNPRVASFIRDVLGDDVIEIPRRSGVRMFGGFHEWPLRPSILLVDAVLVHGPRRPRPAPARAPRRRVLRGRRRQQVRAHALLDLLRAVHAEVQLRVAAELHQDWGRAGVNRAVIDKRASADSLWSLLKTTLLPKPVETTFLYPPKGVGTFSEKLAEGIVAAGGRILLGMPGHGPRRRGRARDGRPDGDRAHPLRRRRVDGAADAGRLAAGRAGARPRLPVDRVLQLRDRRAGPDRVPVDLLRRRRGVLARVDPRRVRADDGAGRARAASAWRSRAARATRRGTRPRR